MDEIEARLWVSVELNWILSSSRDTPYIKLDEFDDYWDWLASPFFDLGLVVSILSLALFVDLDFFIDCNY